MTLVDNDNKVAIESTGESEVLLVTIVLFVWNALVKVSGMYVEDGTIKVIDDAKLLFPDVARREEGMAEESELAMVDTVDATEVAGVALLC